VSGPGTSSGSSKTGLTRPQGSSRSPIGRLRPWLTGALFLLVFYCSSNVGTQRSLAQGTLSTFTSSDPVGDVQVRRTDPGADGPVGSDNHRFPDIVSQEIGRWQPADPAGDLFDGQWIMSGQFVRFDIVFDGLINPPGTLGFSPEPFEPFRFGPNPVYGLIEFDLDGDMDTGGELNTAQLRYLGNAARWGGIPALPRFADRVALDRSAFDGDVRTPPFVERSGEEFHIAFLGLGSQSTGIVRSDNTDMIFNRGEKWVLKGRFFHRAHGYEPFSFSCCQNPLGSYQPIVEIQFQHDVDGDRTTVSLVYPLTNAGSAAAQGTVTVQDPDGDASNQNSVLEALDDLVFSTVFAPSDDRNDPRFVLIEKWATKAAIDYLNPRNWKVTAMLGGSYTIPDASAFVVWTDMTPNVVAGDFNGNGVVGLADVTLFDEFISTNDGNLGVDATGADDGVIAIIDFGPNFSVFDVNYDGFVDTDDRPVVPVNFFAPADFDEDGDVDQIDFAHLQVCMAHETSSVPGELCMDADLNHNAVVEIHDLSMFILCASGPTVPANVACTD